MHTIDTVMPDLAKLRVHIAPVGFEIDRIVLSAKKAKADKVWLLVHDKTSEDKAIPFKEKIIDRLKKARIDVEISRASRLDLFQTIKAIKDIIKKEENNEIYINVASGSKIQAIACMMACMIFNDKKNVNPFYAHAVEYLGFSGKEQSKGVKKLQVLPTYEIQRPKEELIKTLKIIKDYEKRIPKKVLAKMVDDQKIITINAKEKNYEQARFASLDKNIIQPLEEQWKFIQVEKSGRTRYVKITEEGINATILV